MLMRDYRDTAADSRYSRMPHYSTMRRCRGVKMPADDDVGAFASFAGYFAMPAAARRSI